MGRGVVSVSSYLLGRMLRATGQEKAEKMLVANRAQLG